MVQLLSSLNRVKERGNDLTQQAVERGGELLERGNGLTARLRERGELRDHAGDLADRARDAASAAPTSRWAKLAGAGLASTRARAKDSELVNARGNAAFKLMSLVSGILGGALAGAIFNRVWRAVSDADEVPQPTALDRNVREVLIVAALQGAVFGLVKAAFSRTTASAYRRLTGNDPTG
jgi:Protein of unknown function (DUF4235)